MTRKSVQTLGSIFTLFTVSFFVGANTPDSPEAMDEPDVIVVTGSRQASDLLTLTGNIDRIVRRDIQSVRSVHPSDLLNRSTGVHIQANNGMESLPSLRSPVLTGPGAAGAFLILEDGIATRAAGFANNNGLSELNLAQAQEVEIVRGPASAIYGSNAVHGVINVLSAPVNDGGDVTLMIGPNERYQVQGNVGKTMGKHAVSANSQIVDDGGYRDDSEFQSSKIGLRHEYLSGKNTVTTTISGFLLDQDTAGFIASNDNGEECFSSNFEDRLLYKDDAAMQKNCDQDAYRKWSSLRIASKWQRQLSDQTYVQFTPYFRTNSMEFRQHYLPSEALEENSHFSVGLTSSYHWALDSDVALIMGIDLELTEGELTETQQKPDTFGFGKARQQGLHYKFEVDAFTIAPYVQANWRYNDILTFSGSVRFDVNNYNYDNLIADGTTKADGSSCVNREAMPVPCLYQRPPDSKDRYENVSAKVGFNYLVGSQTALFGDWSQGFRAPQITDLYRIQSQQIVGQIDSEQIESQEIGVRGVTSHFTYELVAFYMTKNNFFFRDARGLNVTDGETSHQGIELGLDYQIVQNLNFALNYSYGRHRYEFDRESSGVIKGNEIDTAPRHLANLRLEWQPSDTTDLAIEWAHVGAYYLDPANQHQYSGHNLVQLRGQLALNENITLLARVENLLNEQYASRADYAFNSYRFFGGQPRAIHLGITATF